MSDRFPGLAHLGDATSFVDRILEIIEHIRLFEDFEREEIRKLAASLRCYRAPAGATLIREGDHHRRFGIVVDGFVEVSANGRVICRLGSGEVVGEMAFLHPSDSCRQATVVTLEPTLFLDINSAALDLSSDEVRERFNKVLLVKVLNRLREANKALAKLGQAAVQGSATAAAPGSTSPLELL